MILESLPSLSYEEYWRVYGDGGAEISVEEAHITRKFEEELIENRAIPKNLPMSFPPHIEKQLETYELPEDEGLDREGWTEFSRDVAFS